MAQLLAMVVRALLVWALFILAESIQGALRRAVFGADLPTIVRQVSVGLGVVVVLLLSWVSARWLRLRSEANALAVGGLWVVLTLLFEALVGWLSSAGWDVVLDDYDPRRGGLMAFGVLAIGMAPWLVYRFGKRQRRGDPVDPPQGPRPANELQSPR